MDTRMPLQEPLGFWRPFVRVRPAQKFIKLLLELPSELVSMGI